MKHLIATCLAALLLTGCGSTSGSSTSGDESATGTDQPVVVDIDIQGGKVTPQGGRVDVAVGQKVVLHITSDAQEEIHVHSEPEHEYEITPGEDVEKSFSLSKPGQVAVEAHGLDVTIVQLVVRP